MESLERRSRNTMREKKIPVVSEPSQLSSQGKNIPVSLGTSLDYCPGRKNMHPLITWSIPVLDILFENPPSLSFFKSLFYCRNTAVAVCIITFFTLFLPHFSHTGNFILSRIVWAQNCCAIPVSCTIPGLARVLFHPQRAHLHSHKNTDRALGIFLEYV